MRVWSNAKKKILWGLLLLFLVQPLNMGAIGTGLPSEQETELRVKSLYLYNFAKYIRWEVPTKKFVIGAYCTEEEFQAINELLRGRKVDGKPFEVRKLKAGAGFNDCQIVYINEAHSSVAKDLLAGSGLPKNILFVSEHDFAKKGMNISFVVRNSTIQFKINIDSCERSGLQVSKTLLSLGITVEDKDE